jgi:hypothetical protein
MGHFDRDEASSRSRHVGCGPDAEVIRVLSSAAMGLCGLMVSPGA